MKNVKISCPAKVNLTLEVVNKREDGFHNIKSIMQTVSLYDYLSIKYFESHHVEILLSGNNKEIPYNETNLIYKAAKLFFDTTQKTGKIEIYLDKNIPIAAGLAGGSTDAAGTIYGLNYLFDEILSKEEMHELCAKLGSDLNVCLEGGCLLATLRGEKIEKLPVINSEITLIKPKSLGISAKEAYTKYAAKKNKPQNHFTEQMIDAIKFNKNINPFLYNDLEYAIFEDYKELQNIKDNIPNSIMSGSGSTYFVLDNLKINPLGDDYIMINNLQFINKGVEIMNCNNFVNK